MTTRWLLKTEVGGQSKSQYHRMWMSKCCGRGFGGILGQGNITSQEPRDDTWSFEMGESRFVGIWETAEIGSFRGSEVPYLHELPRRKYSKRGRTFCQHVKIRNNGKSSRWHLLGAPPKLQAPDRGAAPSLSTN